ncbi:2-phosphosulfolactate phosphatase [Pontibacter sp. BT310]|uniref:Probable 2-phosphosulfolactate phosphatase n=1 Tax=Pontibacter populi TaxID=890055 RepID=A0ABS6X6L0_9BACT|nr:MULTISPECIES: 2-phosphosulfolactate phosphatase [Pontibacter]MBJ6116774.1 2-phosphosulfolactate phosphatase [Pontibacter sp. BT310]MBR0569196.1 2-phosphosulfolactate phosphatase [Microvirga sp. STS03]MBW3363627.1 2-phosphosulfolactate phosphatase [Pontibacter populi]
MPSIDVCFSPELLHLYELKGKAVVAVDILRATSTMVAAFAHGATDIIPVMKLEECQAFAEKGCLIAAERDGVKAEGFDLGNSPFAYMDGNVQGRTIAITTTNGTRAIHLSMEADEIIVGAFLNLQAVADHLKELQLDVLVVCAGWKGKFNLEDTLFAGALAERLQDSFTFENDATLASLHLYHAAKNDLAGFLRQSSHVRRLENLEIHKDVEFCLLHDKYNVLPVWKEDRLIDLYARQTITA